MAAKEATVKRARLAKQVMTAKPVVASVAKIADECAKQGEDIPPVWDQGKPRSNIARAAASDEPLLRNQLADRAVQLQLASRQGILGSVASGLRAWREFAVAVLGGVQERCDNSSSKRR